MISALVQKKKGFMMKSQKFFDEALTAAYKRMHRYT